MKSTCQSRHKDAILQVSTLIAAFLCIQSMANPFNDGATNSITTDTTYNETLYVGIQNPDNALIIDSNAVVSATEVVVGQLSSSSNNSVSIIGDALLIAGSAATNGLTTGGLVVGGTDDGAALSINNFSTVNTEYLYVGFGTNDSGQIELSGEGTELNVAQDASIGSAGSTNSVKIGDGATLNLGGSLTVGSAISSNNQVTVTSGGSLFVNSTNNINVINPDGDNGIAVSGNGTLQVGGDVNSGTLDDLGIELAKNANLELGGSLKIDKNKIDNSLNIILNDGLSTNDASWTSGSVTAIGSTTSDNSLTFTNGATGHAMTILQIGQGTTALRNELNVGGSNTLFTADSDVFVGAQGDKNKLNIGDGGQVEILGSLYLGNNATATDNEVNVSSNGILNVASDVIVGDHGSANKFTITDGQVAVDNDFILGSASGNNRYTHTGGSNSVAGAFIIGKTAAASGTTGFVNNDRIETTGNLAIIGTNATLNIQQDLTVGLEGSGSIMTIRDGGGVNVDGNVVIGEAVGDNYIYLQRDSNTTFNVTGDLVVGKEGGANRFAAYGGSANIGGNFYLGATTNQHTEKNFIHLETTNATLNVAGGLYIGASNSINTLDIVAGATANVQDMFVGAFEGVSNNVVTVTGDDALLQITNVLEVGSATGTNNSIIVKNGGTLSVEQSNIVIGSGSNNVVQIADKGTLKTGDWDYSLLTGTATNIMLESGSTLQILGALTGTNMVSGGIGYALDGTNALWNTGTNALFVGNDDEDNSLTVTNGALVTTATNLYIGFTAYDNTVQVGGTGSVLNVGHDLLIGNVDEDDSGYSDLILSDGAFVSVGNNASLAHGSLLKIDSTSKMEVAGDYEQDRYSTLEVGISTNQAAPNLLVTGKANLENGATISVFNDGIGKDDTNVVQNIVVAGNLTIDDQAASTGLLLDRITIETNLLLGFTVTVSNGTAIVLDNFIVRSIGEAADLTGQLLVVADEIDSMNDAGNTNAQAMLKILSGMDSSTANQTMESYYGDKMSSSPAHNAINMGMQSIAEQLTKRADNTRARMGMASATAPEGAAGPHMDDQPMQGWIAGYKTWADKSVDSGFNGYDGSIGGFMIGADMSVAEGILVGIAGGAGSSTLDSDNGASTDTDTTFGSIYMSAGTKDWFADASLIYGGSSADTALGTAFDTTGSFDARNTAIYVGGGKEIIGNYMIITPQASLLANYYKQDGYEEKSSNAVGRRVDSFDALYVQSAVGCNVGFYTALGSLTLKPEFRAFWLHEFNAQDESLSYTLIGGTNPYTMVLQAPEEDIIKLGAGLSAKIGEYLELRADLDLRRGADYSDHTLLGSLRYQF